jgi:hypothetical protein
VGAFARAFQDRQSVAQRHDRQRELQAVVQCSGQLLTEGLPTRLHGAPAWTESEKKASDFRADE